jgi:hypothetical protein
VSGIHERRNGANEDKKRYASGRKAANSSADRRLVNDFGNKTAFLTVINQVVSNGVSSALFVLIITFI